MAGPQAAGAYAPGAFTRGAALEGRKVAAPVQEALAKMRIGDFGAAERALLRHLEQKPDDAAAWGALAMVRHRQERYKESLEAAERALALDPRDVRAHGLRTLDLLALGRYSEAEASATRSLELDPRDGHAYYHRSEARLALGRPAEQLADLKLAAELDEQYRAMYEDAVAGKRRGAPLPAGMSALLTKRAALWVGALGTALLFFSFAFYRGRGDSTRVALRVEDHEALAARALRVDAVPQGFQVLRTLGQGGMGVVYEAMDMALQRTVALKRLRPEVADNMRERARFLKEARVVAGLRHPNIVEIYSVHENEEGLFLVFERVPGSTLHERLGGGSLAPAEALPLLRQVAAALDYAHGAGVVHQDLKPANIMVHGSQVKVMDFGIARRVQETLSTLSRIEVAGTPAYMAPEQEQGGLVGPKADLFALGVCAYELLTGRLPFPHGGLMAKAQGLYRPATDTTPLPVGVDETLGRALAPRPEGRPASASAFVDALARALS